MGIAAKTSGEIYSFNSPGVADLVFREDGEDLSDLESAMRNELGEADFSVADYDAAGKVIHVNNDQDSVSNLNLKKVGTEVELDAYTVPPLSILEQVLILQGKYNEVMQARIIDQMLQEHSMKVLLAALEQPESKIRYTTSPYKINLDTEEIIMGDSIITYDNELGQLGIKTDTKYEDFKAASEQYLQALLGEQELSTPITSIVFKTNTEVYHIEENLDIGSNKK